MSRTRTAVMWTGRANPNWKGGLVTIICRVCGADFKRIPCQQFTAVTCSRKCANEWMRIKAKSARELRPKPDVTYSIPRSRLYPAKNCGHPTKKGRMWCGGCKPVGRASVNCAACGTSMSVYASTIGRKTTCSNRCASAVKSTRQKGPASHLWKGGVCGKDRRERNSAAASHWRAEVMKRDDYTCQICNKRGGRLSADHILPWSMYPELRYELRNGRTLCWPCHLGLVTTGYRGKTLREFIEQCVMDAHPRDPRAFLMTAYGFDLERGKYYLKACGEWLDWKPGDPIAWPTKRERSAGLDIL